MAKCYRIWRWRHRDVDWDVEWERLPGEFDTLEAAWQDATRITKLYLQNSNLQVFPDGHDPNTEKPSRSVVPQPEPPIEERSRIPKEIVKLRKNGEYALAADRCRKLIHLDVMVLGPDHQDIAIGHTLLARILEEQGLPVEAAFNLELARQIAAKAHGPKVIHAVHYKHLDVTENAEADQVRQATLRYVGILKANKERVWSEMLTFFSGQARLVRELHARQRDLFDIQMRTELSVFQEVDAFCRDSNLRGLCFRYCVDKQEFILTRDVDPDNLTGPSVG